MNAPLRNKRSILKANVKSEHFKSSLSTVTKSRSIAIVKWTVRATIKFAMTNGGWHARGEAIIVRRTDVEHVHDYARVHCKLRDFLLVRLPMKIGLRTTEIGTLTIEDIDFESRSFEVLDSKKKRMFPLPLDVLTLQFIKDLIGDKTEGPVFTRETWKMRQNMPLTRGAVWHMIHKIGLEAGVQGFSPRLLRHYFAAHWIYVEHKSKQTLQTILRHTNPLTTEFYLARLSFFEDMEKEYRRTREPYIDTREVSDFYREHCAKCDRLPTCKYVDQVSGSPWASGCRFYKPKKKELIRHG